MRSPQRTLPNLPFPKTGLTQACLSNSTGGWVLVFPGFQCISILGGWGIQGFKLLGLLSILGRLVDHSWDSLRPAPQSVLEGWGCIPHLPLQETS